MCKRDVLMDEWNGLEACSSASRCCNRDKADENLFLSHFTRISFLVESRSDSESIDSITTLRVDVEPRRMPRRSWTMTANSLARSTRPSTWQLNYFSRPDPSVFLLSLAAKHSEKSIFGWRFGNVNFGTLTSHFMICWLSYNRSSLQAHQRRLRRTQQILLSPKRWAR